jgi:hypothetical protein
MNWRVDGVSLVHCNLVTGPLPLGLVEVFDSTALGGAHILSDHGYIRLETIGPLKSMVPDLPMPAESQPSFHSHIAIQDTALDHRARADAAVFEDHALAYDGVLCNQDAG